MQSIVNLTPAEGEATFYTMISLCAKKPSVPVGPFIKILFHLAGVPRSGLNHRWVCKCVYLVRLKIGFGLLVLLSRSSFLRSYRDINVNLRGLFKSKALGHLIQVQLIHSENVL